MKSKIRVGILGATGAVGQKFVEVLAGHPWFEVTALVASDRSAEKPYRDVVNWIGSGPIPADIAGQTVVSAAANLDCDVLFSGLDAAVAGELESRYAAAGHAVISNARNHRMRDDVPLLIPEVNSGHTALLHRQRGGGYIVTNPNCSTVGLVCVLKPLVDAFGVEAVQVTTLQALSGAGYPGVPALDALGNVVPFIRGEEEKLQTEPLKILGTLSGGRVVPYEMTISAQCTRVPVLEGHLECISVKLAQPADVDAVREALRSFGNPLADLDLPGAPETLLHVFDEPHFPQPRRHAGMSNGMTVSVGRVRPCEVLDVKLVALVHNTLRGAAGGAVLNAELLVRQGLLKPRQAVASS